MHADQAGQDPRATEVDGEATPREDLGEPSLVRRDDQVAAQRQVAACPDGDAVDLRDRGLGHAVERQRRVADVAHHRELMTALRLLGATGEIRAGAEVATGPGDHDDAIVVAFSDVEERLEQLAPHRRVRGVLLRRPVECDRDDVITARNFESLHARDDT